MGHFVNSLTEYSPEMEAFEFEKTLYRQSRRRLQ